MALIRTLECNRCKRRIPFEQGKDTWKHIYAMETNCSPTYSDAERMLCPDCLEDLDRFFEGLIVSTCTRIGEYHGN